MKFDITTNEQIKYEKQICKSDTVEISGNIVTQAKQIFIEQEIFDHMEISENEASLQEDNIQE
jgi:hypothetical protein